MACPFPGMDPWLESPSAWPDFYEALASEIRAVLNGLLPRNYYAQLGVREELAIASEATVRQVVPDVTIQSPSHDDNQGGGTATAVNNDPRTELAEFTEIQIYSEPNKVNFVEIRDAKSDHEVVTLIEILSPTNKHPGKDHEAYLRKREMVLESTASLVEIDLLRTGPRDFYGNEVYQLLMGYEPPPEYLVLVQRAWKRRLALHYQLFPARLSQPLPVVAIPLRESDAEITLDLQYAFRETYNRGPYDRSVDYTKPPRPSLDAEHQRWAEGLLKNR